MIGIILVPLQIPGVDLKLPNKEICITELLKVLNLQENVRHDDWNQEV